MLRYRFRCEYFGDAFHGWQVQHGSAAVFTVQSELEHAMAIALRKPVKLTGAGRTDSGVHSRGQCANFDWDGEPLDCELLERSINGIAHKSVRVREVCLAPEGFHARYSALSRYYQYTIYIRPVALAREYGWQCGKFKLDPELMRQEALSFLGAHDFNDFSIPRNDGKSTECILTEFSVELRGHVLIWHIRGNRFLHRQVRSMVGLLIDVGRGKLPLGSVQAVFEGRFVGERMWAPPEGLCLEGVDYPDGY